MLRQKRISRPAAALLCTILLLLLGGCQESTQLEAMIAEARASAAAATSENIRPQTQTYTPSETVLPGIACTAQFDPFAASGIDRELSELLYLRLYRLDETGQPAAELVEKASQTAGRYRFTLKAGLTFADGSAVEARDVVYSLRCGGYVAYADGNAVEMENASDTGLPARLSEIPIIPDGSRNEAIPCPSAAYAVSGEILTDREGNPLYRLVVCDTPSALLLAWQTGEIQSITVYGADSDAVFVHGRAREESVSTRTLFYLRLNPSSRWLANVQRRQAVSAALDREALSGLWTEAAYTLDPPWSYRCTESVALAAKTQLESEKAKIFGRVSLLVEDDAGFLMTLAEQIAGQLRESGLSVTIDARQGTDYAQCVENGAYDLLLRRETLAADLSTDGILNGSTEADCLVIPIAYARGMRYTHIT